MRWENNAKWLGFVCLVSVVLAACSPASTLPAPPPATQPGLAATGAVSIPPVPSLTLDQLKNMDVQLVATDKHPTVKLSNGEYKAGAAAGSPDYADVKLVPDFVALGDLNGDGREDAAFLLSENYGGSGVFVSLIPVLNQDGNPVQAGGILIDDRPKITGLEIQDGRINFTGNVHGPNDPACCAAQPVVESYRVTSGGPVPWGVVTTTPNGEQRVIKIDSPAGGSVVAAGPVQVKGSYTVSPFENTLAYRVTDEAGVELGTGSIQAQGEMGKPGTFDGTVDLSAAPAGSSVWVSVSDKSAADGSTLAMDTVMLVIK